VGLVAVLFGRNRDYRRRGRRSRLDHRNLGARTTVRHYWPGTTATSQSYTDDDKQ